MDEQRLTNLLQHAAEAEAFERDLMLSATEADANSGLLDPLPMVASGALTPRRPLGVLAWGSLAAALVIAGVVGVYAVRPGPGSGMGSGMGGGQVGGLQAKKAVPQDSSSGDERLAGANPAVPIRTPIDAFAETPPTTPVRESLGALAVGEPADRLPETVADTGEGHMLIALYTDDGHSETCESCWCVERWNPAWDYDQGLTTIATEMLIDESILRSCVQEPARVVVVGLSGPTHALPTSDEEARTLAMCLLECADPEFVESFSLPPARGDLCLGSDVDFRIQTWSR